eukprot:3003308-Pyramimonas_sp.AAC.1
MSRSMGRSFSKCGSRRSAAHSSQTRARVLLILVVSEAEIMFRSGTLQHFHTRLSHNGALPSVEVSPSRPMNGGSLRDGVLQHRPPPPPP